MNGSRICHPKIYHFGIRIMLSWIQLRSRCKESSQPSSYSLKSRTYIFKELPWWLNGKETPCKCRSHGFDPWVGKISWKRKWQPTPVFLPGKSQGRRSLVGYCPWGRKESDTTERLHYRYNLCIAHFTLTISFMYLQTAWTLSFLRN